MSEQSQSLAQLAARLQAYYDRPGLLPDVTVRDVAKLGGGLGGGWTSQVHAFTLANENGDHQRRVIKCYLSQSQEAASREFGGMRRANELGYPAPRVHELELDLSYLGYPFITMEMVQGQQMESLLRTPGTDAEALWRKFFSLYTRLHALDWRAFDADAWPGREPCLFVDRWLDGRKAQFARLPDLGFGAALEWLEVHKHEASCSRPVPVHGDFQVVNTLVRDDGALVVIDWAGFMISDLRFDLGWTIAGVTSFMPDAPSPEQLLRGYEQAAGERVANIEFFEAAGYMIVLAITVPSLLRSQDQPALAPGIAEMHRNMIPTIRQAYSRYLERTGVPLPRVEALLK